MELGRLFPVYFNEINAEGEIRDFSSRMDDITNRRDLLVHFLRKQSHVESNSTLVSFVESIFRYWHSGNKEEIQRFLPEEVYEQIEDSSEFYAGMHKIFAVLYRKAHHNPRLLPTWDRPKTRR